MCKHHDNWQLLFQGDHEVRSHGYDNNKVDMYSINTMKMIERGLITVMKKVEACKIKR